MVKQLYSVLVLISLIMPIPAQSAPNVLDQVPHYIPADCTDCKILWDKLAEEGTVDTTKNEALHNRRTYSTIQLSFEKALIHAFKTGEIESAVIIIHTPNAPTPLRVGDSDLLSGAIPKELLSEQTYIHNLRQRYHALLEYLEAGGLMISLHLHSRKPESIPGYHRYLALCSQYPNLMDFEANSIPSEYSGATYFILHPDQQLSFFSIMAPQVTAKDVDTAPWSLWQGKIGQNDEVTKRALKIDSFLKSYDIDIYATLGLIHKP